MTRKNTEPRRRKETEDSEPANESYFKGKKIMTLKEWQKRYGQHGGQKKEERK